MVIQMYGILNQCCDELCWDSIKYICISHWSLPMKCRMWLTSTPKEAKNINRKTSDIRHNLVGNQIVDHSDVVGASLVGAAPTTSSRGWVGCEVFLWWAPPAKREDHHGVSSGWNSVWHRSNTGLSSTQYEQIPIILGVWPFWLTPFFFRSITFWRAYG